MAHWAHPCLIFLLLVFLFSIFFPFLRLPILLHALAGCLVSPCSFSAHDLDRYPRDGGDGAAPTLSLLAHPLGGAQTTGKETVNL